MNTFQKATRKKSFLRLALCGPSGSGKTYTALQFAKVLAKGGKIACIDTEHGSASLYAGDVADFDVVDLENYGPREFISTIKQAEREGYSVLVVDSLSHAWRGVLDEVDRAAARIKGNSFAAWRDVTPLHNELVDTILASRLHVICTMRSKTEWVLEEDSRGKKSPRKIGMAPVQRDGVEYEFTVVGDMDDAHRLTVTKSRCSSVADEVVIKPGGDFAQKLLNWLDSGADVDAVDVGTASAIETQLRVLGLSQADGEKMLGRALDARGPVQARDVPASRGVEILERLAAAIKAKAQKEADEVIARLDENEAAEAEEEQNAGEEN